MELIHINERGNLNFGNHLLEEKSKQKDFEYKKDRYYVKTFKESTRLEKNEKMLFESIPGTTILDFDQNPDEVSFYVEAVKDVQITLDLIPDTVYEVFINEESIGGMKTGSGGKLDISVEKHSDMTTFVRLEKN